MAVQLTYPGVYIEEFTPGAPIAGVGTSTAAFLGPTTAGPLRIPTKLTSWEAFLRTFGAAPAAGSYLWYAVRGFFENGGTVCYVVRVSTAQLPSADLLDSSGGTASTPAAGVATIHLEARAVPSMSTDAITVTVADASTTSATAVRPTANVVAVTPAAIRVTNAAKASQFVTGDVVFVEEGSKSEAATVVRVDNDQIRLAASLQTAFTSAATVRLQSVVAGTTTTLRVEDGEQLSAGSVLNLAQGSGNSALKESAVVQRVERIATSPVTWRVTFAAPLTRNYSLAPGAGSTKELTADSVESTIVVKSSVGSPAVVTTRTYDELSMSPLHPRYFAAVINGDEAGAVRATPVDPPNPSAPPKSRPFPASGSSTVTLSAGRVDDPTQLTAQDYKDALRITDAVDDINLLCIPDQQNLDVQMAMVSHCELTQDRFAILDSVRGAPQSGTGSIIEQLHGVTGNGGGYAALYYPWISVAPAVGSRPLLVPPCGHVAGIFARTDQRRGVFKAPAGVEAGINGALGVDVTMTDVDQGQLNMVGVNVIRVFRPGDRPIVWGARTTATEANANWQYVNVRRLFLFLEESIQEGIRWALFEPNTPPLWKKLKRTINGFLLGQWRDGALFGNTPEEAYYIRIDEVLNTDYERSLGRLHIEIGVRPAYPAEFIVVRIGIWQGGSDVSEG